MNILVLLATLIYLTNGGDRVLVYPNSRVSKRSVKSVDVQLGGGRNEVIGVSNTKPSGSNKKWEIWGEPITPINGYPFSMKLAGKKYGFANRQSRQELALTMRARCRHHKAPSTTCDLYIVLAFGTEKYISFAIDLDGEFWATPSGGESGLQAYPKCKKSVASGDASTLLNGVPDDEEKLRDALAGNDYTNWYPIDWAPRQAGFPITLELINFKKRNKFILKFASKTYPNGLECAYIGSVPAKQDLTVYMVPGYDTYGSWKGRKIVSISSIAINGNRWKNFMAADDELEEAEDGYSIGDISEIFASEMDIDDGSDDEETEEMEEMEELMFMTENNDSIWSVNKIIYSLDIRIFALCVIGILLSCGLYSFYKKWKGDYKSIDSQQNSKSENKPLMIDMQTKY